MNRTSRERDLSGVRAVILDMDGVIVDSEPLHEAAQDVVFAEYALDIPFDEYARFKGRPERDVFQYVLDRYDVTRSIDLEAIIARKHHEYRARLSSVQPVAGAMAFIQSLAGRIPLALTTSSAVTDQQMVFELLQLGTYFDAVITADDVTQAKPHPEPYLRTLSQLGANASETLVIEDSLLGVESALGAGCVVAGLVGTFPADALAAAGAHFVISSFDELPPVCEAIVNRSDVARS